MSIAIPIPSARHKQHTTPSPSLQSVIHQKKLSNSSIKNLSTSSATNYPSSLPSLSFTSTTSASTLCSYESCDSHPLLSFDIDTFDDIEEDFFMPSTHKSSVNKSIQPVVRTTADRDSPRESKTSKFVSNLTSSLKSFKNSNSHNLLLDIQPRLTDDRIPVTELKTFSSSSLLNASPVETAKAGCCCSSGAPKQREPRINSQFLRLYSYESNSRKKGLLPDLSPMDEQLLDSNTFNSLSPEKQFALKIRQKLWQQVVLPPKEVSHANDTYVYVGNSPKVVKPWCNFNDELNNLKPVGSLGNVQFVIKGWCNSKWISS